MKPPTLGHLQRSSFSLTIAQVWVSVAHRDSSQLWSRPYSLLQGAELAVVKGAVGAISASGKSVFLYWCRRVRGGGKYSWLLECTSKVGGTMMSWWWWTVDSLDNVCSNMVVLSVLLRDKMTTSRPMDQENKVYHCLSIMCFQMCCANSKWERKSNWWWCSCTKWLAGITNLEWEYKQYWKRFNKEKNFSKPWMSVSISGQQRDMYTPMVDQDYQQWTYYTKPWKDDSVKRVEMIAQAKYRRVCDHRPRLSWVVPVWQLSA